MKKSVFSLLLVSLLFYSCQEKSLKEQYKTLNETTESKFKQSVSPSEQDSLIDDFKQQAYILLQENIGKEYSDSIFLDIFYLLSVEEQESLFNMMPNEMKEEAEIAACYKCFTAQKKTSIGCIFSEVQGLDTEGNPFALSSIIGSTDFVLVDFWASWCGPCRRALPKLKALSAQMPEGKLTILGVSCDKDTTAWLQTIQKEQLPWQQIRDTDSIPYTPFDMYGVRSIPTTILIDSTGLIIARNPSFEELMELLK